MGRAWGCQKQALFLRHRQGGVVVWGQTDSFGCHPVADKKANELGIYDMSGNVMELCWDMRNSRHPVRGGSWKDYSYDCHIHDRSTIVAAIYCSNEIGFRVARNLRSKTESHG